MKKLNEALGSLIAANTTIKQLEIEINTIKKEITRQYFVGFGVGVGVGAVVVGVSAVVLYFKVLPHN